MADDSNDMNDDMYDEEDEDTLKDMYLTFRLADEDYGIEIRYVTEIVGIQKITEVPDMPEFVKGVVNLRGQVIPVIDVRLRFHMQPRDYDERTCVIVVSIDTTQIGLVVDTVNEVRAIPENCISPAPKVSMSTSSRYIRGMGKVGDEVKILLDASKLLFEEELSAISA